MADVSASAPVSNATSGGGGGAVGGGNNYQSAPLNIISLPNNLQSLSQNINLGARLVASNPDGSVVLGTAQGNITVTSPLPLQANAQLQVQFQAGNPPTAIVVLLGPAASQPGPGTVNLGQTVGAGLGGLGLDTLSQVLSSNTLTSNVTLQQGANVAALVIGELPEALPNASSPTQLAANNLLQPGVLADTLEQLASGNSSLNSSEIAEQVKLLSQFGMSGPLPDQIGQLSLSGKLLTTIQQTLQQLQAQTGSLSAGPEALKALLQQTTPTALPGGLPTQYLPAAGTAPGLVPGTPLDLKILQILQPGQAVTLPGGPGAPNFLVGQVASQTLNGLPLVQTPQGAVLLQAASKLMPGSTIIFELQPGAGAAAQAALLDAAKTGANPAAPKLELALQLLAQTDNETFTMLMNNMPRLNGQFPPNALFFLQALQTGDIRNWLGDAGAEALRRAGPLGVQLLGELEDEFKATSARANDTKPGEWRVMTIPYLGEYGVAAMQFGVRNHFQAIDPDERRKFNLDEDAGRVTRFIFDINFSELGPMQVDGLLRPRPDYQKQLDILLRTQHMLPPDMRQDLRNLFTESLGAYGMNGMLTFQAGYQNWISLTGRHAAHSSETRA